MTTMDKFLVPTETTQRSFRENNNISSGRTGRRNGVGVLMMVLEYGARGGLYGLVEEQAENSDEGSELIQT